MALPKTTLRDLFWIVVVVAMGVGWWADRRQLKNRMGRDANAGTGVLRELARQGFKVQMDGDVISVERDDIQFTVPLEPSSDL
jgi:hypothetical protein